MRRQMASRRRQMASRHQMASRRQMPSRSETRAQEHSAGRSQGSSSWRPSCRAARCGRRSTRCARVGWRTGGRSRRRSRRARCRLPRVSSPFGVSPVFKTPREPLSKLVPFYTLKTCALSWWPRAPRPVPTVAMRLRVAAELEPGDADAAAMLATLEQQFGGAGPARQRGRVRM